MLPRRLLGPQGNTAVGRMMACIEHLCAAQICLSTGNHFASLLACASCWSRSQHCSPILPVSSVTEPVPAPHNCSLPLWPLPVSGSCSKQPPVVLAISALEMSGGRRGSASRTPPPCRRRADDVSSDELEALFRFTDDEAGPPTPTPVSARGTSPVANASLGVSNPAGAKAAPPGFPFPTRVPFTPFAAALGSTPAGTHEAVAQPRYPRPRCPREANYWCRSHMICASWWRLWSGHIRRIAREETSESVPGA